MQRQGHGDPSSTPLEHQEGQDAELPTVLPTVPPTLLPTVPPAVPATVPQQGTESDLNRYEEDEVATVPWPPPPPSHPRNIEA
jgi:hypothetical protein